MPPLDTISGLASIPTFMQPPVPRSSPHPGRHPALTQSSADPIPLLETSPNYGETLILRGMGSRKLPRERGLGKDLAVSRPANAGGPEARPSRETGYSPVLETGFWFEPLATPREPMIHILHWANPLHWGGWGGTSLVGFAQKGHFIDR